QLPVPPALAVAAAIHESAGHGGGTLCLAIDGQDPPPGALEALDAEGIPALPMSACDGDDALRIDANAWRTDGSGSGTVEWSVARGTAAPGTRAAAARREGDDWHVTKAP